MPMLMCKHVALSCLMVTAYIAKALLLGALLLAYRCLPVRVHACDLSKRTCAAATIHIAVMLHARHVRCHHAPHRQLHGRGPGWSSHCQAHTACLEQAAWSCAAGTAACVGSSALHDLMCPLMLCTAGGASELQCVLYNGLLLNPMLNTVRSRCGCVWQRLNGLPVNRVMIHGDLAHCGSQSSDTVFVSDCAALVPLDSE